MSEIVEVDASFVHPSDMLQPDTKTGNALTNSSDAFIQLRLLDSMDE